MRIKRWLISFQVLILAFWLVACQQGPTKSGDSAFSGTPDENMVVIDVVSEMKNLNPFLIGDVTSISILRHCMSGLTRLDSHDRPVADLAESWQISEDNTRYTMYLRKDAKWSNGEPVTANDFYFSWVTQMRPETGTPLATYLIENIKNGLEFYAGKVGEEELGIRVVDDYTLEIEWQRPMVSGLFYLAMPTYFPMNQKAYEQIGAEAYGVEADQMMTNGPYRITEWVHDDHLLMEQTEESKAQVPARFSKIKLTMIGDNNTRLNAFMAGQLDICNIYSNQIEQLKAKDETVIQGYSDGGSWYFSFQLEDPYISNLNLRKALAYSVDMQSLLDTLIKDGSVPADGLVPYSIGGVGEEPYAKARGSLFAYDKEKAKGYLDQALSELSVSAEELKLALSVSDSKYSQDQAAYFQQQWKENLGLTVEIRSMSYQALSEARSNGEYQISCTAWGPDEDDAISFLNIFTSGNANNTGLYSNPEYDKLIKQAIEETDLNKRQEQMIQAEKLLIEEMGIGPMYFTQTAYAASYKAKDVVRTAFQSFHIYEIATPSN